MIKTDWRIVKSASKRNAWDIETRAFEQVTRDDGYVSWSMLRNWSRHSTAASKRAAYCRIVMMKERGEIVSWSGGPIRIGSKSIDSSPLNRVGMFE